MSQHHTKGLSNCQNCHYPLAELDKFCPNCGQKNTDGHVSLHDLWHEVMHYFMHVDNKIFVTIKDLLIPGKLTDEFFKGHRKRYIHPINLFFVIGIIVPLIGAQIWKKAAEKNQMDKGFIKEKELYRNDLLFEMDSMVKHDSSRFSGAIRPVLDSFLLENYQRSNVSKSATDTSDRGYQTRYFLIIDKMQDARKAVKILADTLQIDKNFVDKPLIKNRLDKYETYLSKLKYDSITLLSEFSERKNKPYKDVEKEWAMALLGYNMGKSLAMKNNKPKPLTLDSLMRYPVDYDPVKIRQDSLRRIIKRDSAKLGIFTGSSLKIADLDLANMTDDALMEKYKVTDWKEKIMVKQAKRFGQQGMGGLMKAYNEKSTWVTILSIIPAAWLLLLMYKSQNRLYVEHLVFLLHFSTLMFIVSALMLIPKDWMLYVYYVVSFTFLTMGIKRFYKQSWGKSILKSVLFFVLYTILGVIIGLVGLLLSVLFS